MEKFNKFKENVSNEIESLFQQAKRTDELAYIFSLLGFNSGMEDVGWQPINETIELLKDIVSLSNAPLKNFTKIRLFLLIYCQLTEANYIYHVIYNMLLTVDNQKPPQVFNFLEKYRGPVPPAISMKLEMIKRIATRLEFEGLLNIFDKIYDSDIRNAVSHADFILFDNKFRLKHRGDKIMEKSFDQVTEIVNYAVIFFQTFFQLTLKHQSSYTDGYVINNRMNKSGSPLSSVSIIVDDHGFLIGFKSSDSYPIW